LKIAQATAAGLVNEPLSIHHFVPQSITRSDKRRNTLGNYRLLKAIEMTFDDLTLEQRKAVRRNLAQACRQVGYEAGRDGRHAEGVAYLVESFRFQPSLQSLRELSRAFLYRFLTFSRTPSTDPQPLLDGVR
jgi:hypothetical protein